MDYYELYHHGVKGQKWGQRRYQNKDGSLTALGRKRLGLTGNNEPSYFQRRKADRIAKKAAAAKAKEEVSKCTAEEKLADKKAKVLDSRSAKELYKNAHLFSDAELESARKRLELEKTVQDLSDKEIGQGKRFMDKLSDRSNTVTTTIASVGELYNNVARVYNSFTGKDLPIIDFKAKSKSAAEKSKEVDEARKAKAEANKAEDEARKTKLDADEKAKGKSKEQRDKEADERRQTKANADKAEEDARTAKANADKAEELAKTARSVNAKLDREASDANEERSRQEYEKTNTPNVDYSSASGRKDSTSRGETFIAGLLTSGTKTNDVVTEKNTSEGESYVNEWLKYSAERMKSHGVVDYG